MAVGGHKSAPNKTLLCSFFELQLPRRPSPIGSRTWESHGPSEVLPLLPSLGEVSEPQVFISRMRPSSLLWETRV